MIKPVKSVKTGSGVAVRSLVALEPSKSITTSACVKPMGRKLREPKAQEIYRRCKVIVESVFGDMKNLGFRGFRLRPLEKVKGEFALMFAAYNFL
jgi:hypothetical protein